MRKNVVTKNPAKLPGNKQSQFIKRQQKLIGGV